MGSTIIQAETPQWDMLRANRALRALSLFASPGRLGRPLKYYRPPGMDMIDRFYYSNENVDRRDRVPRFTATLWRTPALGPSASSTRTWNSGTCSRRTDRSDYAALLGRIKTPTLLIAGTGDIMSDIPSTELMFTVLGCPDKELMEFGKSHGQVADYGHCDLVWSRHAPQEIFPRLIEWLDRHQPTARATPQSVTSPTVRSHAVAAASQK